MAFLITIGISTSLDRSRPFALPPVRDWRPNPGPAPRHPVHGATVAGRRAPFPPRRRHRRYLGDDKRLYTNDIEEFISDRHFLGRGHELASC